MRQHSFSMSTSFRTVLLSLAACAMSQGPTGTVYIIRHGEKTGVVGCLSDQGHARAHALPKIFDGRPSDIHATFQIPKALFANFYGDPVDCERTTQTLKPIAREFNLSIDNDYGGGEPGASHDGGNPAAADAIRAALVRTGGPVLVSWEHFNIWHLTQDLGVAKDDVPSWPTAEYDWVHVIEIIDGEVTTFRTKHQNFMYVPKPFAIAWEVKVDYTCSLGIQYDTCVGHAIEDCKTECAADPKCSAFIWPEGHMKGSSCLPVPSDSNQTLFLKMSDPRDAALCGTWCALLQLQMWDALSV